MVSYIIGIPERDEMINRLAAEIGIPIEHIILDTEHKGPLNSILTALSQKNESSHVLFIQDDAKPCDDFINICERIISTHPNKVIGLFPFDFVNNDRAKHIENIDSPYYCVGTLSGVGIIFPTKYSDKFIEYCKTRSIPWEDDRTIFQFCNKYEIEMIETYPAVVQHIGTKSYIWPKANIRQADYFENQSQVNWENEKINVLPWAKKTLTEQKVVDIGLRNFERLSAQMKMKKKIN